MADAGPSTPSKEVSPAVDFSAGVVAGVAGLVVGQPFDVVKVRYQTPSYSGRYTSILGAFRSIIKEEKVHGLFKGVTSPMAGIAFINGMVFTSYSFFMKMQLSDGSQIPSLTQICLAGAGSGLASSLITSPTELIKQSAPPHLDPSVWQVCRQIIRTDGLRGLYRGFPATALRDLAYGPYFLTYEGTCRYFRSLRPPPPPPEILAEQYPQQSKQRHHESLIDEAESELSQLKAWELMTAGGLAGVVAWIATFPVDVFKTRMQGTSWEGVAGASGSTAGASDGRLRVGEVQVRRKRMPSLWSTARGAVQREGWRVMFAGLGPTLVRAVPVNMVVFFSFEACVAALSGR